MKRPRGDGIAVTVAIACFCFPAVTVVADERSDRVDRLFDGWVGPDTPGCAVGIIQNGRFLYRRGYGLANLDHGLPIAPQTVFRVGSVSKQFTAMATLLAAEEGRLSLDDDIRKYLPELPEHAPPVTIRHMLHHTSGLRDYLYLMDLVGKREDDYYTNEEVLALLARQKTLNFAPGGEFLYSNTGYFLLSQIIPRATGKTLREWAEEKIFRPLGMNDTHFHDDLRMVVPRRATGYRKSDSGVFEIDVSAISMVGDGGIFTTVEDLFKWDRSFYVNVLGGTSLMHQMLTPGRLNDGTIQNYALGLRVSRYRGLEMVGHGGSWVGYRAATLRFPEERFAVICLCNRADAVPWEIATEISDIYLSDAFLPQTPTAGASLPASRFEERVGTYWNARTSGFANVEAAERALKVTVDESRYELRFLDEVRFVGMGEASLGGSFEKSEDGAISMRLQWEGQVPLEYQRLAGWNPDGRELDAYPGTYHSDELGVSYRISSRSDGSLVLEGLALEDPSLHPVFKDGFRWEWGSVVFERNASGEILGLRLSSGPERNLEFVRRR